MVTPHKPGRYLSVTTQHTVPSGDAILTTIGNTRRNELIIDYLIEVSGIESHEYNTIYAGDDAIVFIEKDLVDTLIVNM